MKPIGQLLLMSDFREEGWGPNWKDQDGSQKHTPEVAKEYQTHILGDSHWAQRLDGQTAPRVY